MSSDAPAGVRTAHASDVVPSEGQDVRVAGGTRSLAYLEGRRG